MSRDKIGKHRTPQSFVGRSTAACQPPAASNLRCGSAQDGHLSGITYGGLRSCSQCPPPASSRCLLSAWPQTGPGRSRGLRGGASFARGWRGCCQRHRDLLWHRKHRIVSPGLTASPSISTRDCPQRHRPNGMKRRYGRPALWAHYRPRGSPFNRSSPGQSHDISNRTNGHFGAMTSTNVGYLPSAAPLRWRAQIGLTVDQPRS